MPSRASQSKLVLVFVCLTWSSILALLSSCTPASTYQDLDRLTPGIFLQPESETILGSAPSPRQVSEQGLGLTKLSEGFVDRLYNDAAHFCSIGYGHLVKKAPCDGTEVDEFRGVISEPRGAALLMTDMQRAEQVVMQLVTIELTDGQYGALCDFTYNVGAGNLAQSTLLRAINSNDLQLVPHEFRRWVLAGGREVAGLRVRRDREIDLFFEGMPMLGAADGPMETARLIDIRLGEGR